MLVGYVIPISPNLHYFSIWFVCIFNHPTTFFSVLSNFLTSVVSCVTHSLGCEVVSRVSGSLSLFATCTLAFSIHLYAFSTVRRLPPPPPPPPAKFALSFARSFVRSFIRSFACTSVHSCVRSFVCSLFVRRINLPVVCSQNCSSALSSVFRRWHFFFFWRLVYSLFCGWFY